MKSPFLHAALCFGTTAVASGLSQSPNVLIIYTDEHNFRTIEAYLPLIPEAQRYPWGENVPLKTPNLNYLAENGVIMNNCYVSTPVSTPSRASFMTGLYAHKTSAPSNSMVMDITLPTVAQVFKNNGYKTGYAGKWHLSGNAKPGWNSSPDYGWEENDYMINRGHYKSVKDSPTGGNPLLPNSESALIEGYDFMTEYLADKTIDFIGRNVDNPFLYMVSIPDPHGPNVVTEPYLNLYKKFEFLKPPTSFKNMSDYPGWARGNANLSQSDFQNYWGMVKCIDDNVGRIIESLREHDLLDKTIIIFTSDHGDMCGEHGRVDKSVPLDGSMKVPFIVYAPSFIATNLVVQEAVSNIDVFPTLVDLCDIEGMPEVDGISIASLLKGVNGYKGKNLVFSRSTGGESGWIAATTDRYKLVVSTTSSDKPWLIDKQEDPDELVNFFEHPYYDEIKEYLKGKLIDYCEENDEPKFLDKKIRDDLGVPPVITDTTDTNLIQNGFFDFGSTGWKLSNSDIVFETNLETGINGITCRFPGVNNNRHIQQVVDVKANTTYSFEFKGRIQNAVGASGTQANEHTSSGIATLKGEVLSPDNNLLLDLTTQMPQTTDLNGEFTTSSEHTSVLVVLSKNWNIAYVDDVFLTEITNTGTNDLPLEEIVHLYQLQQGFRILASSQIHIASVLDLTGRLIKQYFNPGKSVDVAPIQNGMYIASVTFSEGISINRKYLVTN